MIDWKEEQDKYRRTRLAYLGDAHSQNEQELVVALRKIAEILDAVYEESKFNQRVHDSSLGCAS